MRIRVANIRFRLGLSVLLNELDGSFGIDNCLPPMLKDGEAVAVRRFELAAAISRLRGLSVVD
jgi:hypothetical protein